LADFLSDLYLVGFSKFWQIFDLADNWCGSYKLWQMFDVADI
jgi:hypothetical protein